MNGYFDIKLEIYFTTNIQYERTHQYDKAVKWAAIK